MYDHLCTIYYDEMDHWFRSHNINQKSRKKFKYSSKPFWNDHLSSLWEQLCIAESQYLNSIQNSKLRKKLLLKFKESQSIFDKFYKKYKRKFQRDKQFDIERLNTDNPKEFWNALNNLGPRKSTMIPMEVYDKDGTIIAIGDKQTVLNVNLAK